MRRVGGAATLLVVLLATARTTAAETLFESHFERVTDGRVEGWQAPQGAPDPTAHLSPATAPTGKTEAAARLVSAPRSDWLLESAAQIPVRPGDTLTVALAARITGDGKASAWLGADGRRLGEVRVRGSTNWQRRRARVVVPANVGTLTIRVAGSAGATFELARLSLRRHTNLRDLTAAQKLSPAQLANDAIVVSFNPATALLEVLDRDSGRLWVQATPPIPEVVITEQRADTSRIELAWRSPWSAMSGRAVIRLEPDRPEIVIELDSDDSMPSHLAYPAAFASPVGARLVLPINEGFSFPVDDESIRPMRLPAFSGHQGLSMSFWGTVHDDAAHMAIIETPDDAELAIEAGAGGRLHATPRWLAQRGDFAYPRRLRYVFFARGDHVSIAKRYRAHARQQGLLVTLEDKRRRNPDVDLLVGAANVWYWRPGRWMIEAPDDDWYRDDALPLIEEMRALGMERLLWSRRGTRRSVAAMNSMETVLTGRFDNFRDTFDPQLIEDGTLERAHPDWRQAAWPDDLARTSSGRPTRGWAVIGTDQRRYWGGAVCDRRAWSIASERIRRELGANANRAWFADTATAVPWEECYDPAHPMTRSDSRRARVALLKTLSQELGVVTGAETGHDAAVPVTDYFEGMMSLAPFRIHAAGSTMRDIIREVPMNILWFQLGHRYRLPLWELVYHDCVVAHWYWGDYSNKFPALWDKRDLFNALYGTPPMFLFERRFWEQHKKRFVLSYERTAPVARAAGYEEMVAHDFLTNDRDVQRTRFANGVEVTVNFGGEDFETSDGTTIPGGESRVRIPAAATAAPTGSPAWHEAAASTASGRGTQRREPH